jgi:hypothetical protein
MNPETLLPWLIIATFSGLFLAAVIVSDARA